MNFKEYIGIETDNFGLTEATFSEKRLVKVVQLYSKILGKTMGGEFKPLGLESYKRKSGPGKGYRVMNNKGVQLRFNWDTNVAKEGEYTVTSIDYWATNNNDFQHPTRIVKLAPDLNVVQILGKLSDALLTGSIHESKKILGEAKLSKADREKFVAKHDLPASYSASNHVLNKAAEKRGLTAQLEAFNGSPETNSFEGEIKKVEKAFTKQVYANPETVFEDIEDLLGLVASGKWRTLIVCGQGGIGKCLQAEQTVNVRGLDI